MTSSAPSKVAVKIRCRDCNNYFHVQGLPIRGLFSWETTLAMDWQEMDDQDRVHLQTRWFWECPMCNGRLDYLTAPLEPQRKE